MAANLLENDGYDDFLLFCQNPDFYFGFGLEIRILTPSRVESIGKTSIFGLETTTNR